MDSKKIAELKPSTEASANLKKLAGRAREINDRFAAQGRHFSDSAETVRADRDSR